VIPVAPSISYIDLNFLDVPKGIGTGVYVGSGGVALVDPGPGSCIDTLRAELARADIGIGDIRSLLLTHIHLDHAGVAGLLVQHNPAIKVFVHEKGAPHIIDPSKLVNSANQLWGVEGVAKLWGAIIPVPAQNLTILRGGERIDSGVGTFHVQYTPGHAAHHVSYFDEASGIAWVGDTGGLRFTPTLFTLPPTPPPDIDIEAWLVSLATIRAWKPQSVFVTHCGAYGNAAEHLDSFETSLRETTDMVRRILEGEGTDEEKYQQFRSEVFASVARVVSLDEVRSLETVGPLEFSWRGLVRYWRKRQPRP
jgi:glyoxylase-like metal-dependent hydrolase (beta-lactamase superfamily II)